MAVVRAISRQKYPQETPYVYAPLLAEAEANRWNEQAREELVKQRVRGHDIPL